MDSHLGASGPVAQPSGVQAGPPPAIAPQAAAPGAVSAQYVAPTDARVTAALAHTFRTGPATAPVIYTVLLALGGVAGTGLLASMRDGQEYASAVAVATTGFCLFFVSYFIVRAGPSGLRRTFGFPRPWTRFQGEGKSRTKTVSRTGGAVLHTSHKSALRFRGLPSVRLNEEWEKGADAVCTYAQLAAAKAAGAPIRVTLLELVEGNAKAPRPGIAGPIAVVLMMAVGTVGGAVYASMELERRESSRQAMAPFYELERQGFYGAQANEILRLEGQGMSRAQAIEEVRSR